MGPARAPNALGAQVGDTTPRMMGLCQTRSPAGDPWARPLPRRVGFGAGGFALAGRDDERVQRALLEVLATGPHDILPILEGLRERLGAPFRRGEGIVHAFLHRAIRQGAVEVAGPGPQGRATYRMPQSGAAVPASIDGVNPGPVSPKHSRIALRLARAVRSPSDRGRVQADVLAHLEDIEGEAASRFGSTKTAATLLRRVDRNKRTIAAAWTAGDFFKRVLFHDGPWILGVVAVFFLVRGYVLEVFRIPTGSMIPTLQVQDRVAVWKLGGMPERYDIATFQIKGTTYVKRLMGLPGEEIALWNGDVFIDQKRLVKPDEVRETLRFAIQSWHFSVEHGNPGPGPDWRREVAHDEVTWIWNAPPLYPNGGNDVRSKSYGHRLRDGYLTVEGDVGHGTFVATLVRQPYGGGDTGPRARVTLEAGREGIQLLAYEHGPDGGAAPARVLAHDERPRSGSLSMELAYVDGVIRAQVGPWNATVPFELPDEPLTFEVGTRGPIGSGISRVLLDADIHYAQRSAHAVIGVPAPGDTDVSAFGHRIPADHVFFLGDNTTNSRDSRTHAIGDVPASDLTGPVVLRVWPFKRIGSVR